MYADCHTNLKPSQISCCMWCLFSDRRSNLSCFEYILHSSGVTWISRHHKSPLIQQLCHLINREHRQPKAIYIPNLTLWIYFGKPKNTFAFLSVLSSEMVHIHTILPHSWQGLPDVHCQYHGCWWSGDARSHSISSHGTDLICLESLRKLYELSLIYTLPLSFMITYFLHIWSSS